MPSINLHNIDPNFQTPVPVAEYMVSLIPEGCLTVLEPTPGLGNIVKVLLDKGYAVEAAQDFFLLKKDKKRGCVIMNPPFSEKWTIMDNAPAGLSEKGMRMGYYMLTECMEMSNHVIALMPWFTISDSDVRLRNLKSYGLKSLTALPRKTFQYARIQTVVIELEKGYQAETAFRVFDFDTETKAQKRDKTQVKLELIQCQ